MQNEKGFNDERNKVKRIYIYSAHSIRLNPENCLLNVPIDFSSLQIQKKEAETSSCLLKSAQ